MDGFLDKLFASRQYYGFYPATQSVEAVLYAELRYHMQQLEEFWAKSHGKQQGFSLSLDQLIDYKTDLQIILLRFREILRFLKTYSGPKIFEFVCKELYDFVLDKVDSKQPFTPQQIDQISLILTVLNICLEYDILEINDEQIGEIHRRLKEVATPLFEQKL